MSTTTQNTQGSSGPTWSELRAEDGTALVISFEYFDDHSSWRVDELSEELACAYTLLAANSAQYEHVRHVDQLHELAETLEELHKAHECDEESCEAGMLADQFRGSAHASEEDASDEYQYTVEYLDEVLDAWRYGRTWLHTERSWDVDVVAMLDELKRRRYGLGERWSVSFTDESVQLPDGTTVWALTATEAERTLFETLVWDDPWDNQAPSAREILALNRDEVEFATEMCRRINARHWDEYNHSWPAYSQELTGVVCRLARELPRDRVDEFVELVIGLQDGWQGHQYELLNTCEALLSSKIATYA